MNILQRQVIEWCERNNYTELEWWGGSPMAYPPNGVMRVPLELSSIVREFPMPECKSQCFIETEHEGKSVIMLRARWTITAEFAEELFLLIKDGEESKVRLQLKGMEEREGYWWHIERVSTRRKYTEEELSKRRYFRASDIPDSMYDLNIEAVERSLHESRFRITLVSELAQKEVESCIPSE